MRFVVVASPESWHYLDLKRAANDLGHSIGACPYETIAASSNDIPSAAPKLENADCILVRTMPPGSLQQVVFRMDVLGQFAAKGKLVLNSPKSIEAAIDKYLTLSLMESNGIPVPRTMVCQTLADAMEHFDLLGRDVVAKPIFGSMGRGIERLTSPDEAERYFRAAIEDGQVIYQQEFIEHGGYDIRVLLIGDQVLGMKRTSNNNWITNISQGATGQPHEPTDREIELAITAAKSVGARFAGVDILYCQKTNRPFVLEVNAVPGWKATSQVLESDVAKIMLQDSETLLIQSTK